MRFLLKQEPIQRDVILNLRTIFGWTNQSSSACT